MCVLIVAIPRHSEAIVALVSYKDANTARNQFWLAIGSTRAAIVRSDVFGVVCCTSIDLGSLVTIGAAAAEISSPDFERAAAVDAARKRWQA